MKTHEPQHHAILTMEINDGKEKSRCLNRSIIPPRVPLVKKNNSQSDGDGYGRTTIALSSHK